MAEDGFIPLPRVASSPGTVQAETVRARLASATAGGEPRLREAARDFEALLITQMIQAMRQTVPDGGLLESDSARETYFGLLDVELGKQAAQTGGLGIAQMLERQLRQKPAPVNTEPSDKQP